MKDATFRQLSESKCNKINTVDVSCQSNQKQYRSAICTCKRHKKTQIVYRDNNSEQSSIELGVERVKVKRRNKIIVYLPENKAVPNMTKKISLKCVSFVPDHNIGENLYNIQKQDTSNEGCELKKSKIKGCDLKIKKHNTSKKDRRGISIIKKLSNFSKEAKKLKNNSLEIKTEKSFSSNSSIERIYNLESSTSDNSKIVSVSNEDNFKDCNSLSLKNNSKNSRSEKPTSASLGSSTYEKNILKQSLSWVRESSKDLIVRVNLSKAIHKDVSITCSPPSLIARSLSSTKVLSKKISFVNPSEIEVLEDLNNKEKSTKEETKPEDVKTMFSLWEKKFNFEDVPNRIKSNTIEENETDNIKVNDSKDTPAQEHKKNKNIFSFFRKKNKEKNVNSFKRKEVTAGRCELSDGIVIKIALDNSRSITSNGLKKAGDTKDDENILQQSWLKNFITNSGDSRKSVQLRWGNKLYGTSSNTISEHKNYTCKEAAIILKSKSDIRPNASLQYDNRPKQNVNFKQDIKACMMPNTICQIPVNKRVSTQNNNSSFSSNCKKFRGQSKNHIEIFLPAKHFSRDSNKNSDYITIHIPEEYFSDDSEDQNQCTDEEVYNIEEFDEPLKSNNVLKDTKIYTGYYLHNNTKEKRQTTVQTCREVVVKGSNVCVPKVIEVGVITQRDMTCLEKSMKPQDNRNESQHLQPQRKCDLAETYLRDHCRNVMPLGLDLFTSHMSKSQWQLISLNSSNNCSNCDLCIDSNKVSSKSSTEQGSESSKMKECKQIHTNHFFSKLRKKTCGPLPPCNIRTCPKDSIEVCKKRKIYACSNKSKWGNNSSDDKTKTDSKKSAQSTASSDDKCMDPCSDNKDGPLDGILKFKGTSDCSNCKNNEKVTKKTATVIPDPICQIPQPPCIDKCASVKNPICTKTISPTCHARSPECISPKSKVSQTEPSETKVAQTKSPQVRPSSSLAICSNAVDSEAKREVDAVSPITCFCSGDENILPISESLDSPKKSLTGSPGHYIPPPICHLDPNSYCCCKPNYNSFTTKSSAKLSSPPENKNTTTTFYQKSLVNAKRIRCNCIGKRNVGTSKCAPDIPNCNTYTKNGSSHLLSAKPSRKSSKQSNNDTDGRIGEEGRNLEEVRNEKGEAIDNKTSVTSKPDSTKENTDKIKGVNCDEILSTKENTDNIEGVNCDEILKDVYKDPRDVIKAPTQQAKEQKSLKSTDANTIQRKSCDEMLRTKENTDNIEGVNCDEILKDVYKDPRDVIKAPTQQAKEQKSLKSTDANTIQRKLSVSDIIEINICLKFRNPEASKVKIRPQYTYNVDEKSDIQNLQTGSSQIYQVNEREDNQIRGQTEDINFTINIQTVKPKCSLSNEHNLNSYYTATTLKRNNSINFSDHFLHDHQPALNLTNSINKVTFVNKQIANFEMSCGTDNYRPSKTTNSSLINDNISENNSYITIDNISEISDDLQEEFERTKDAMSINESIKGIVNRKLVSILKKLNRNEKKEVLKQILETVGNTNGKNKAKKVKIIKHLMYAVLTSECDFENVNDVKSRSTSSTRRPLGNSSKSSSLLNEMFSEKRLKVSTTPTHENGSSESNNVRYVSSNMKEKMKRIIGYNRTDCCCSKTVDIEDKRCSCNKVKIETINCCCKNVESDEIRCCHKKVAVSKEITEVEQSLSNQKEEENFEEKAIHDSKSSEIESIIMTEMSTTMHIESKIVSASTKKVSNSSSPFNNMRQTRHDKLVYLASDKVLFFLSDSKHNSRSNIKRKQYNRPEDILQLRKTKRAVLKIYSQRRMSSSIIKLPKFVSHGQCIQPNQPI